VSDVVRRETDQATGNRLYTYNGRTGPSMSLFTEFIKKQGLLNWMRRTSWAKQEKVGGAARNKGTRVHDAMERKAKNHTYGVIDEEIKPSVQSLDRYVTEHVETEGDAELFVFSEKYGFGGTLDRIVAMKDGSRHVIDWKTSKNYNELDLWKTEGYKRCWEEMSGESGLKTTVVYADAEGGEARPYTVVHNDSCFEALLSGLHVWKMLNFTDLRKEGWSVPWLVQNPLKVFLGIEQPKFNVIRKAK